MIKKQNSSVFITGAQSGTGYGIAEHFAKNGYDVFITSRRKDDAQKSAKALCDKYGIFAKGYECNIRNEQQVIDIFNDIDQTGKFVETVILNAANMGFNPKDPAAVRISGLYLYPNFKRFLKQILYGISQLFVKRLYACGKRVKVRLYLSAPTLLTEQYLTVPHILHQRAV